MKSAPKAPPAPCGSCPYRRDVPSGIWAKSEYDKLPEYDGPTWAQSPVAFHCHQRDGHLCGGWLACHDPRELLALRFPGAAHESVYSYRTDAPVFASGAEARAHGLRDLKSPDERSRKMTAGLLRKRAKAEPIKWADRCPRCRKRMTPEGWIRAEGYVCTRCVETERAEPSKTRHQ